MKAHAKNICAASQLGITCSVPPAFVSEQAYGTDKYKGWKVDAASSTFSGKHDEPSARAILRSRLYLRVNAGTGTTQKTEAAADF